MAKDDENRYYINEMIESIDLITQYIKDKTFDEFKNNKKETNLLIISFYYVLGHNNR